jgi:hypothetical protein
VRVLARLEQVCVVGTARGVIGSALVPSTDREDPPSPTVVRDNRDFGKGYGGQAAIPPRIGLGSCAAVFSQVSCGFPLDLEEGSSKA